MSCPIYLFALYFEYRHQQGLAIVSASSEVNALAVLKNQGNYNASPDDYKLVKSRNLGVYTTGDPNRKIFESYVDALIAYDAICKCLDDLEINFNPNYLIGTTEYWNSRQGFIPANGTIIIYTDYHSVVRISPVTGEELVMPVPGIKIGTGNAYVQDLAFCDEWQTNLLLDHIYNTNIHVTPEDKQRWNNKLNCENEITDNTLIFNRL